MRYSGVVIDNLVTKMEEIINATLDRSKLTANF